MTNDKPHCALCSCVLWLPRLRATLRLVDLQSHSNYHTCASSMTNKHETGIHKRESARDLKLQSGFAPIGGKEIIVLFHHRGLHKNEQEYICDVPHYNKQQMQTIPSERHALLELVGSDT